MRTRAAGAPPPALSLLPSLPYSYCLFLLLLPPLFLLSLLLALPAACLSTGAVGLGVFLAEMP